jgi:hypothetical protein
MFGIGQRDGVAEASHNLLDLHLSEAGDEVEGGTRQIAVGEAIVMRHVSDLPCDNRKLNLRFLGEMDLWHIPSPLREPGVTQLIGLFL